MQIRRAGNRATAIVAILALSLLSGCGGKGKEVLAPPVVESQQQDTADEAPEKEAVAEESEKPDSPNGSRVELDAPALTGQAELLVYLNGNCLELDTQPCEAEGEILVPAAQICESFSRDLVCTVQGDTLTIEDAKMGNTIVLTAGSDKAVMNGGETELKAPAALSADGVMLVEFSAFQSLLDADCKYQEEIQSVYITESGLC